MARRKRSKTIVTVLLSAVWLAVVIGGLYVAITQWSQYGLYGIAGVVIAVGMLLAFVFDKLPKRTREKPAAESFSKLLTGAIILGAVLALVAVLVAAIREGAVAPAVIIGFFAFIFIRIFIDYVKDMRKPKRKRRSRRKESSGAARDAHDGGSPEPGERDL